MCVGSLALGMLAGVLCGVLGLSLMAYWAIRHEEEAHRE